jgi:hypothetical protein
MFAKEYVPSEMRNLFLHKVFLRVHCDGQYSHHVYNEGTHVSFTSCGLTGMGIHEKTSVKIKLLLERVHEIWGHTLIESYNRTSPI